LRSVIIESFFCANSTVTQNNKMQEQKKGLNSSDGFITYKYTKKFVVIFSKVIIMISKAG
jgi:hypothetical protein